MLNAEYYDNKIVFYNENFSPEHIFECGQAFRWEREEDGSYTVVAFNRVINVSQDGQEITINNTDESDFRHYWFDYFDLEHNYQKIMEKIPRTEEMDKAMDFGYGIRILQQDIYETTISFIISANNRIPMIKKSIEKLAFNYGDPLDDYMGKTYYAFPRREVLASQDPADLRELCRVGFRDERIVRASQMMLDPSYSDTILREMDTPSLRAKLMELPGVGPKVADCILLFAFARTEVFPVDVWIKRIMEELYIKKTVQKSKVDEYARELFGDFAGYAQQYLFFYGREHSIGKN